MKDILVKWNSISLVKRIIGGMVIGAILGMAVLAYLLLAYWEIFFVNAFKSSCSCISIFLVMSALAQHKRRRSK